MPSIAELLERESRTVDLESGDFERLVRRRDRKRRNQRLAAGVMGIAVFVAAIWIVTSGLAFDRSETSVVPGGGVTGPAETGPAVVTGPAVTGAENPEPPPLVEPVQLGTVTSSGGGCTLEIDAETIRAGAGRLTVVNETDRPVSFDLFRLTSLSVAGIEAYIASGQVYAWPPGQFSRFHPRRTGAFLLVQREVGPGASGTITDNFTTGALAVVCAHRHDGVGLIGDVYRPFAFVGPIVVP